MPTLTYTIQDQAGIHARPAGILVKLANGFQSDITIAKGDKTGNLKKIFTVMSLNVKAGEQITVTVSGPDETEAAAAIGQALAENL
ncbi:MAG: HPr family phosphocarrier protein [Propionibacteriaceae bacterium]|jgi:phosphocarrier protein|nr:HPr family phosphocarrier protein [Propionibacteriaceae bacterium]